MAKVSINKKLMQNFSLKIKLMLKLLFPLVILFVITKLSLRGTGLPFASREVLPLMFLIIVLSASKKSFWFICFPLVCLYALYLPVGMNFGSPSFKYFASVLATDYEESKEFLSMIPMKHFTYSLIVILGAVFFRVYTHKKRIRYTDNKAFLIVSALLIFWYQSPFKYPKLMYSSLGAVYTEQEKLANFKVSSDWTVKKVNNKYKNYVLIIGESARKDYHHAYGYPISNTPFMDTTKGVLVDGLTSGGTNTIASLRLMLTKPDTKAWAPNYQLNFIDMANTAGLRTVWLSNQGYFGKYDTPISAIAQKSNVKKFVKMESYDSKNTDDSVLLPFLENELAISVGAKSRLIVLHLYGSHPRVCDRLHGFEVKHAPKDPKYNEVACYVASINKTDNFLEHVNDILENQYKAHDDGYSMIYFSDHGLVHVERDGKLLINNNKGVKEHYAIPLLKISSDDHDRKVIQRNKSGLNFTAGLAKWMGIESDAIHHEYDLFSDSDDQNDYDLDKKLKKLKSDPALDLNKL